MIGRKSEPGREPAQGDPEKRAPLDAAEDIIDASLWLAGSRGPQRSFVSHVTVRILALAGPNLTRKLAIYALTLLFMRTVSSVHRRVN
jgi:hypothetical protein